MKLTALELGEGNRPSCFLLKTRSTQVLFECPLDLSSLLYFLPVKLALKSGKRCQIQIAEKPCKSRKFQKLSSNFNIGKRRGDESCTYNEGSRIPMDPVFKVIEGQVLLDAEPWYKATDFSLLNVSSLDAVLVSCPEGMMGLPFLTRMPEFSAKVFATIPTATIGRLMMEELVSLHAEYIQTFGKSDGVDPCWLQSPALATLPENLRRFLAVDDSANRGKWYKLYSEEDVQNCLKQVHLLHNCEEVNIGNHLRIMPFLSGAEIGSSNWDICGVDGNLAYFSSSAFNTGHAMGLEVSLIERSETLLFSALRSKHGTDESEKGHDPGFEGSSSNTSVYHSGKIFDFTKNVCKSVEDALKQGGSVLVTMGKVGALLELLERICIQLKSSNLEHIPIFFLSSVAKETLAFANTVPEWLCTSRQEKFFAGENLFSHVELMKEKRLQVFSAIHSEDLIHIWQEPCIVFASHWSLRMGPAMHLLHRWCHNPMCLLVMTEDNIDIDLALSPFNPLRLQIIHHPLASGLREEEIISIAQKLRANSIMVPETRKNCVLGLLKEADIPLNLFSFYSLGSTLSAKLSKGYNANMSSDLALELHPRQLKDGMAIARLRMSLGIDNGKVSLELPSNRGIPKNAPLSSCRWGSIEVANLLKDLNDHGIQCVLAMENEEAGEVPEKSESVTDNRFVVVISSPAPAKVILNSNTSLIEADDPILREKISDSVKCFLCAV